MSSRATQRHGLVARTLRHPLWAPLNDGAAWDRLVAPLKTEWSFTERLARVERVVDEAPAVRSVWLRPNRRFAGHRAGQHLMLELEIDGARRARCFSIANAPRPDRLLRLTIKRHGAVSGATHALVPGAVVRLGAAQGDFAPRDPRGPLLLLSAGSGVTPMLALLEAIVGSGVRRDVVVLHADRYADEAIFAAELRALGRRAPHVRVLLHGTRLEGRLDAARIERCVPDWRARETLLCGPDGFMRTVEAMYADAGLRGRLHTERFGRPAAPVDPDAPAHVVRYGVAGQAFMAPAGATLLDAAEAAGLAPRFGCRRGICRTCTCLKRSGVVTNLLTGRTSGPGAEPIQLCISTPQGAVELELEAGRPTP